MAASTGISDGYPNEPTQKPEKETSAGMEPSFRVDTIQGSSKSKSSIEKVMSVIFTVCGLSAVVAVFGIAAYMVIAGTPAIREIGIAEFLFGTQWRPTAEDPSFGILYIILTSVVGTGLSVLLGVPVALMTAVFLAALAPKRLYQLVRPAVELLAGIPSVIYGLLGSILLVPLMRRMESWIFAGSTTHQFTGGANLISAVLVLAIMILPTVINVSETSLRAVPREYREASLALGATQMETIFKVTMPAAKSGVITGVVLGIGRAIGEAMAIMMVSGNVVNIPLPFNSVRFLTTGIVTEMSYSSGLHRQALFSIGLVLFVFIMVINILLSTVLKKGGDANGTK